MKAFIVNLFFCLVALTSAAQEAEDYTIEYMASRVYFSKIRADDAVFKAKGTGVVAITEQTSVLTVSIPLFPILTGRNDYDSIKRLNQQVFFTFRGVFPDNTIRLENIERDRTTYSVTGELSLNGVKRLLKIDFDFLKPVTQDRKIDSPQARLLYPAHISFTVDINPAEFNLDLETAKFTQLLTIEVVNGVINKIEN